MGVGAPASLSELADRLAIRELTARYNRAFDDVDPDAYARVFTEDGVLEVDGEPIAGREALIETVRATGYGIVHITSDAIVAIDGDAAVQECTLLTARRAQDRSENAFLATGRYRDELVRTPDGWRFKRRSVTMDLALDL